ncbi:MAG: tRNA (guanosine(37)-N1)-methyltransferase TrmD [Deltaproteobacteria bacterium]|nr:MAG: tRNA (guanosine(37)-N1)-methyltransferase TrmD [Deltaproteobacteria bacterium]
MNFAVMTIFPEMFNPFVEHGIIRRAIAKNKITVSSINIRDFAEGKHSVTDDRPFGGGCGMLMKPEPLFKAIRSVKTCATSSITILLTPQGRVFNQKIACELASLKEINLVCGRYEGIDERVCHDLIDDEISIGDYVLTGGELAAMVIIDSVTRLVPGTLGGVDSAEKDSFSNGLLEHPHYTRPRVFEGSKVPEVLLSGNHREIEKWRLETSLIRTFLKRQDLLENRTLKKQELEILKKWCLDIEKIIHAQSSHCSDPLSGDQQE